MLYPILAFPLMSLAVILCLRLWTIVFTNEPITSVEAILRSFVNGFREGYNSDVVDEVEEPDMQQTSSNTQAPEMLTLEVAESMAEALIAQAWSEAKTTSRQSTL